MKNGETKMNKSIVSLSAALILGLSIPAFAEEIQGIVNSVDRSANSVVIGDPATGASRTVRVHPKVLADLDKGAVVKATLKPGSDDAATLEVIVAR